MVFGGIGSACGIEGGRGGFQRGDCVDRVAIDSVLLRDRNRCHVGVSLPQANQSGSIIQNDIGFFSFLSDSLGVMMNVVACNADCVALMTGRVFVMLFL